MHRNNLWFLSAAALLACSAVPAAPLAAQNTAQAKQKAGEMSTSPLVSKLETCTTIKDDSARLACFDREVRALVGATNEGEVKVVQTEEIEKARKRLFGFSLPKVGLFGVDKDEEVKNLTSTITKVRKVGRNEWHFWIEEGNAKWRFKNNSIRARAPKVGQSVEFKPASMGTFWIRIDGRKGVRGNRIG